MTTAPPQVEKIATKVISIGSLSFSQVYGSREKKVNVIPLNCFQELEGPLLPNLYFSAYTPNKNMHLKKT